MSVSIYDLAREAELLKSNISRQQSAPCPGDSPPADVWSSRQRLEDIYRQILLLDLALALERGVQEDLWTFVFRTQINSLVADTDHQQGVQREETEATLSLFLESVSCFYYQLLHSICHKHRVSLPNFLSCEQMGVSRSGGAGVEMGERVRIICQDCLLRMGDVAGYKGEAGLATKYYYQAEEMLPGRGHVSNQLGLAASSEGDHFTAAYHFAHTTVSSSRPPSRASSLDQLLQTHARRFPDDLADRDSFQTGFLFLLSLLHFSRDLSPFCHLLPRLRAPLSSLILAGDISHEFMLSLVGLCLFACTTCIQTLHGTTLDQELECLASGEQQKQHVSLQLLLEITSVLISACLSLPRHQLSHLLPFISALLRWIQLNLPHISADQLAQPASLWTDLALLVDRLCLEYGFERSVDTAQSLSVELSLFGFLHTQHQPPTARTHCTYSTEELCLGKMFVAIRSIIKEKLSTHLSLSSNNGVYKLSFTATPPLTQSQPSPDLSPAFPAFSPHSPPQGSNSSDYSFFPSIWSNNPDEQTTPELVLPSVASADNIKSLWNVSDIASPN